MGLQPKQWKRKPVKVDKNLNRKNYISLLQFNLPPDYEDGEMFQDDSVPRHTSRLTEWFPVDEDVLYRRFRRMILQPQVLAFDVLLVFVSSMTFKTSLRLKQHSTYRTRNRTFCKVCCHFRAVFSFLQNT